MRTKHLYTLAASSIKFADIPAHDLEVADYAALAQLDIGQHAERRVLVKSTGEVFRYDPRVEGGKGGIFVATPFSGGTASAVGVAR